MYRAFACTQACGASEVDPARHFGCDEDGGAYKIKIVPFLSDNYAYLVINSRTREAVVIDAGEATAVLAVAEELGAKITGVLTTHFHGDHAGGNEELARRYPSIAIFAGEHDAERTPGATRSVADGEAFEAAGLTFTAIHTPSHTLGHVCFLLDAQDGQAPAVFTGDMLFVCGCGRFMEGSPQTARASLQKIAALDPRTRVFCGHEYTKGNLEFAHSLEPRNSVLENKLDFVRRLAETKTPSVPSTIAEELQLNPFLRVDDAGIQQATDCVGDPIGTLAKLRRGKDTFTPFGRVITFVLDTKALFSRSPD